MTKRVKKETPANDREIIYNVLYDSIINGRFSNDALRRVKSEHMPFITDTVYGVIERKITLQYILDSFSNMKKNKIQDEVRILIYIGIYHLLYTNIKPYAAIYEIVEMVKKKTHNGAASFANGILRSVQREKDKILKDIENSDFSIKYSVSEEFLKLLRVNLSDEEIESFLKHSFESPLVHVYVRRNEEELLKVLDENSMEYIQKEDFIFIKNFNHAALKPFFEKGDVAILDYSTSFIRNAFLNIEKQNIKTAIDLCAAPGGKTLLISDALGSPKIVSGDINDTRVNLLLKNINTWGLSNVIAKLSDATEYEGGNYDLVVADVPCSGSGVIRRRPELKYKIHQNSIDELNVTQKKILSNAKNYVKNDGYIIYSTCSILKQENEDVLEYAKRELGMEVLWNETFMLNDEHEGFFASLLKVR